LKFWLKVIVAFASISAIGAWLRANGNAEIWALILIFAQIADMLFDTLPYFQQRISLPQQQLKLEHIEIDFKKIYCNLSWDYLQRKKLLEDILNIENLGLKQLRVNKHNMTQKKP